MLVYKIDILQALKNAGYTTYKIKTEGLLAQGTLQKFRRGEVYHGQILIHFAAC